MKLKLVCISAILLTFLFIGGKWATAGDGTGICGLTESRISAYKERISPFAAQIQSTLKRLNVDEKFIWLAMVESGGNTDATSPHGAAGLWQLTASTAKHYGCSDLFNVDCSTEAAARYLVKLLNDFGGDKWKAIVAYNMGGTNYRRTGKPTNEARHLANTVTCLMENANYVFDN